MRLFTVADGTIRELRGHTNLVYSVDYAPDGHELASVSDDGTVRIWDLAAGASAVLRGHTANVEDVAFAPDGKRIASISVADKTARIWDLDVPYDAPAIRVWLDTATTAILGPANQLASR